MRSTDENDVKAGIKNRANRQLVQLINDLRKTLDEANWFKKLFFPRELRNALIESDESKRIGSVCDVLIFLNPWRLQCWLFPILMEIKTNSTIQKLKEEMESSYGDNMDDTGYGWDAISPPGYHYLGCRSWEWPEVRTKIINRQDPTIANDNVEQGYHEIFYKPSNPNVDPDSLRIEIWNTILSCYSGREFLAAVSVSVCFEYGFYCDALGKEQFGRKKMVIKDWQEMIRMVMMAKNPNQTIAAFRILKDPQKTETMCPGSVKLLLTYREAVSQKEDPVKFALELRRFKNHFLQKHSPSLMQKTPEALIKLQHMMHHVYSPLPSFFKSERSKNIYTDTQTNQSYERRHSF